LDTRRGRGNAGVAMIEVLIAVVIIGLLVVGNVSSVYFCRNTTYRDQDKGIMTDFMTHYAELVRGLPFEEVVGGKPLNGLYDGTAGAPNIRIPVSTNWVSLATQDYAVFHPDLVWLNNRNPEMRVSLTTEVVNGEPHTKHLSLEVHWRAPLGTGPPVSRRLDILRVRDL